MRAGSFDKSKPGETDSVEPDLWLSHIKDLLGPEKENDTDLSELDNFVKLHQKDISNELDLPLTKSEVEKAIKKLKKQQSHWL